MCPSRQAICLIFIYWAALPHVALADDASAVNRLSPRERTLQAQAEVYGDRNPLARRLNRQLNHFQKLPEHHVNGFVMDQRDGAWGQGAVAFLELTFAGQKIRLYWNQPQTAGGRNFLLLKGAGISFLLIDGIARAVLTYDEREATISPLLTYAQIQTSLVQSPNDRPALPPRDLGHAGLFEELMSDLDKTFGASEILFGLNFMFTKVRPNLNPHLRRAVRIGGPLMLVDGAMRAQRATALEASVIPLTDYVLATLSRQPVYGTETLGDLTEEWLRRLDLVE